MAEENVVAVESAVADVRTAVEQNQEAVAVSAEKTAETNAGWITQLPRALRERVESPESYKSFADYMTALMDEAAKSKGEGDKGEEKENPDGKGEWDEESWNALTKDFYALESADARPIQGMLDVLKENKVSAVVTEKVLKALEDGGKAYQENLKAENDKKAMEAQRQAQEELLTFMETRFGQEKTRRAEAINVIARGFELYKKADPESYRKADEKGYLKSTEFMSLAYALSKASTDGSVLPGGAEATQNDPRDPFGLFRTK